MSHLEDCTLHSGVSSVTLTIRLTVTTTGERARPHTPGIYMGLKVLKTGCVLKWNKSRSCHVTSRR